MPLEPGSDTYIEKIEQINNILIELASGNFDTDITPSDDKDELDAIVAGINMLREELVHSTVSKEFLEGVYNGIVDMLVVVNHEFNIQTVNDAITKTLEYEEPELLAKPLYKLVDPASQEELLERNKELESSNTVRDIELDFQSKGGKSIPVSYSASELKNKFGKKIGYLYIAKDITKIKKTEHQLLIKNKELDTFVYKSSHDLKGPLASIIGLTNIANMEIKDEVSLNYFNLIRTSAIRLDNILINLSELARLRNSATKIDFVDLGKITTEIVDQFMVDGNLKKVLSFKYDIDEIPNFRSNDKIILSVLQNLIDNAIKYRKINIGAAPYVHITISKFEKGAQITIKDNGLGIRKDKVDKVFDMFQRANEKSQGTGLGLYIVKTSVEKLKGTISLKSVERQGSTFKIYLPSLDDIDELIND